MADSPAIPEHAGRAAPGHGAPDAVRAPFASAASDAARCEAGTLAVERGACYALFAYDIGLSIDLEAAQQRITADKQRQFLRHKRRAPYYFAYQPAPVRVSQTADTVQLGAFATEPTVDALLYDFGAVSVQFTIPLHGPLANLRDLSNELYHNPALLSASRRIVESLLPAMGPAVSKPAVSEVVEDYAIYQIEQLEGQPPLAQALESCRLLLAHILRAETAPLASQEIDDALACRISFGPDDLALLDWNAALLFDRDADAVRAVLEYANVELLEMRFLDDRLDAALDRAYEASGRHAGGVAAFTSSIGDDLNHIARLQTDSALLYEGVNNALKLLGDQYLARVHRLVSQRFHLEEWDQSIHRKLQTLQSIYAKLSDQHANRRMELLEWMIILLIALDIVLPVFGKLIHRS